MPTTGDDVVVHRGVRFARAYRFHSPALVPADRVGLATTCAAPQLPSRLEAVLGRPAEFIQDEDCLSVTVITPTEVVPQLRPVLVWFHGGAYVSGSGHWNHYDATKLVAETGIVVVSVNYRLGALGFLRLRAVSDGNWGLHDQIAALEWVHENIDSFGGDPTQVTVAGQSAGAHSIVAMLGIQRTAGLFSRVIVHSAPLGLGFHTIEQADAVGALFERMLADDPTEASVAAVLQAQASTMQRRSRPFGMNSAPPFMPVHDVDPLPDRHRWAVNVATRLAEIDMLIGATSEEMAAFWRPQRSGQLLRRLPLIGPWVLGTVERRIGEKTFATPVWALADRAAQQGAHVHCFCVTELSTTSPYGACHGIDLPLLFGDEHTWRNAPMLSGTSYSTVDLVGQYMRGQWAAFVHGGTVSDPHWPAHTPGAREAYDVVAAGSRATSASSPAD